MTYPKMMINGQGYHHRARSAEEEASLIQQGYRLAINEPPAAKEKEETHKTKANVREMPVVEAVEEHEETHERKHAKHK